jgi:hypothetical protein
MSEHCLICNKIVPGFENKFCCNGFECECRGMPINPCICSEKCWNALMSHDVIGSYEDRRIAFGIDLHKYDND